MDERQKSGGYGDGSGPPDGLGSNFISFGADEPESPQQRDPPWNRRGGRGGPQLFSGNRRGHAPFMGRDGPNQSYHSGFNRPFGNARGRGYHQQNYMRGGGGGGGFGQRGNRNQNFQRHQGPRNPNFNNDSFTPISAYYHPSMMEDPWRELETLLKLPQSNDTSSKCEEMKNLGNKNTAEEEDSEHPAGSVASE